MVSLRQVAYCIGITDGFRVLEDFFGYVSIPSIPLNGSLSLRTQLERLRYPHIHLNLIRVGIELFNRGDEEEIDYAVQYTRDIYATVDMSIGRVQRCSITTAESNGREAIGCDEEARILTREWTVPNNGLDVFFVRTYAGLTVGFSAINGPCNKNSGLLNGSVVAIEEDRDKTGAILAHEIGHYLGLNHSPDQNNLMHDVVPTVPDPRVPHADYLTSDQGDVMLQHCFVRAPCWD